MATIPCSECGHTVSERAVSCPNCGAPVGGSDVAKASNRVIGTVSVLIVLAAATVAWMLHSHRRHDASTALTHVNVSDTPAAMRDTSSTAPLATTPAAPTDSVYKTTADQLTQEFNENAVAAQRKIGGRRVLLSGIVAAIDEDADNRAVLKLKTKFGSSADFTLNDDQKPEAAQLNKGQSIEVDCAIIRHAAGYPQGSGCALVTHPPDSSAAYLAVRFAADTAQAPLYIVGPLAMNACLSQTERISGQLNAKGRAVSKLCSASAQDNIQIGCRLDSTMTSLPDLPQAHVWHYSCAKDVATGTKTREISSARRAVPAVPASSNTSVAEAAPSAPLQQPSTAPPEVPEEVPTPLPTPVPEVASAPPPSSPAVDIPADLSTVSTADPKAAAKINSYCNSVTSSAANRDAVAAGCRHEEAAAWSRFVAQNEYPTLDDATRNKCNEPPFPDSYVAKEACAKYQLRQ